MKKLSIMFASVAMLFGVGLGVSALDKGSEEAAPVEKVEAATDYSSTIRVYVDLSWDNINYMRVGGNASGNNCVLSSSNSKYRQDLGKYVLDISSSTVYERMGCFFQQGNELWQYAYDGGYIWIDNDKFQPGYEFQIYNINWKQDGNPKLFTASVKRIGTIKDNVSNPTFYFIDGYSWHASRSVTAYFWGGTASPGAYPGVTMTDSSLRIKAKVGDTEYLLYIYQYTVSGTAAHVKFSNNNGGQETGDLDLENNGIYMYGVDGNVCTPVTQLLVSLKSNLGSYTYNGRTFTSSICHLTQSQASTFVSTYDTLVASGGDIASSVQGSGIITYTSPETSTSTTGEVSLEQIRTALVKKYPTISASSNIRVGLFGDSASTTTTLTVIIVAVIALGAVGGFFIIKRKKKLD
jgi:hypothetical protein